MVELDRENWGALLTFDTVGACLLESDLIEIQRLEKFAHDVPRLLISCAVYIEGTLVDWQLELLLLLLYASILIFHQLFAFLASNCAISLAPVTLVLSISALLLLLLRVTMILLLLCGASNVAIIIYSGLSCLIRVTLVVLLIVLSLRLRCELILVAGLAMRTWGLLMISVLLSLCVITHTYSHRRFGSLLMWRLL